MVVYIVLYGDGTFTEIAGVYTNEKDAEARRKEMEVGFIVGWIEAHEVQ